MSKQLVQPQCTACQGNYPTSSFLLLLGFSGIFVFRDFCISMQLDVLPFCLFLIFLNKCLQQELIFDSERAKNISMPSDINDANDCLVIF